MSRSSLYVFTVAVMAALTGCAHACEVDFGKEIVESLASSETVQSGWVVDFERFGNEVSMSSLQEPKQVMYDETWGMTELAYCFSNGSYAYLTMATRGACPKELSLAIFGPELQRSQSACSN